MDMEMEMETKRRRFMDDDDLKLLPPEICSEILSRLPADSAIGCRGICKQWRSLIDHPSFVDTHTRQVISSSPSNSNKFGNYLIPNFSSSSGFLLFAQQQTSGFQLQFVEYNDYVNKLVPEFKPTKPITDNPFQKFTCDYWGILLISSCNGFLFMGSTKPNYLHDVFVCNPFTREYMSLPTITDDDEDDASDDHDMAWLFREIKGCMSYGFGYLPSTNEYKVVSIYYPNFKEGKGKVNVYTLGSGKWRNKGETPYWVYSELHPGLFANGAIHWFTSTDKKTIVSFDLADEEFRVVVPLPPPALSTNHVDKLGVLGGCLCVTRSDKTRCESPKDIWVLNVHNKEKKFSWNKRFSIPWKGTSSGAKPQIVLKSGKILLLGDIGLISYDSKTGTFNEDGLISYDSKTESFGEEEGSVFYDPNWLKVIPYAKSFVSLKALGEKDAKYFGGVCFPCPCSAATTTWVVGRFTVCLWKGTKTLRVQSFRIHKPLETPPILSSDQLYPVKTKE